MTAEWRLVEVEYEDPFLNMALEEAIPTMVGKGFAPETIRFWRNANAVVIGRFQHVQLEVNLGACQKHGTSIVRRFTGGGSVYQDLGNLNYAITLRKGNPLLREDIVENLRIISRGVVEGLNLLGLSSKLGDNNMVQVNGKKISGAAGSLTGETFFQHGTLLINTNLQTLSQVLDSPVTPDTAVRGVRSIPSPVTSIRNELGEEIGLSQVKTAIRVGFEKTFSARLVLAKLTSREEEISRELYDTKYSRKDWNLQS